MKEIKNLFENNKKFLIIELVFTIGLLIISLGNINSLIFLFISIMVNILFINILKETKRILKIDFTKKEKHAILISILLCFLFYFISLLTRKFIYYWDYSCYYNIQLTTMERFQQGLQSGIYYFLNSTYSASYGNFLSFIPQVIFQFTNKTENSYIASYVLTTIPYIVFSISLFLKTLLQKNKESLFGLSLLTFILLPLLHATSIYGQPDFFGLFFIFMILTLTNHYDFKKIEIGRLLGIFINTYLLFISRRWYIYWILTYYMIYGLQVLYKNRTNKKDLLKILKNASIYIGICIILFIITLHPLMKNIIESDFQGHYIYYKNGGVLDEIIHQIKILGISQCILIGMGIIIGLFKKEYREKTGLFILQTLFIIILFNRIQAMGYHHSLMNVTAYTFFTWITLYYCQEFPRKQYLTSLIIIIMIFNFMNGFMDKNNLFFTEVNLKIPYQEDYEELKEAATWLKNNLNEQNTAYMITHTDQYNPDKLRNIFLPDKTISKYLPYGSAIIGVHPFPTELFTSKYIITTTPFERMSIEYKYEEVFEKLIEEEKFQIKKIFNMNNSYQILIYERVKEVDEEEINLYEKALKEESKQFPELYQNVIEKYKKMNKKV